MQAAAAAAAALRHRSSIVVNSVASLDVLCVFGVSGTAPQAKGGAASKAALIGGAPPREPDEAVLLPVFH